MLELLSSFKREGEEIERRRGAGGGARDKGEKKGRERVTGLLLWPETSRLSL